MEDVQVDLVGVVGLECDAIPEQLFRELLGLELVPFVGRWAVLLVSFEAPSIELLTLFFALMMEDALVGFDAQAFAAWSRSLVFNEGLECLI